MTKRILLAQINQQKEAKKIKRIQLCHQLQNRPGTIKLMQTQTKNLPKLHLPQIIHPDPKIKLLIINLTILQPLLLIMIQIAVHLQTKANQGLKLLVVINHLLLRVNQQTIWAGKKTYQKVLLTL